MRILTHRWLEPENPDFHFFESSFEAFENQLSRWFWLEFDINFSKDGVPFVFHDPSFIRISNWTNDAFFSDLNFSEILDIWLPGWYHFAKIEDVFSLISQYSKKNDFSALHIKAKFQSRIFLDKIIEIFDSYEWVVDKVFLFDLVPESARYLKRHIPKIRTFASVAHPFDVKRFSSCVGWTLLIFDEFLNMRSTYDWAWLDEWDRTDENWLTKALYVRDSFQSLRNRWFQIAVVSPELHASSPWLYGGESHQDCGNERTFINRLTEIISLNPDYVCTDRPSTLLSLE